MPGTIRIPIGYSRVPDNSVLFTGYTVQQGMDGNLWYPNPPIAIPDFKAALDSFAALIAAALDGGRIAMTAKNKQRRVVTQMLRQLAMYVQATCNGDAAIFATSGFQAISGVRAAPQPLTQPLIFKINYSNIPGVLLVFITPLLNALHYELRCALLIGGIPGPWGETMILSQARQAATVSNLTPGQTYAFEVRARGKLGYTPWSDYVTKMST